MYIKGDCMIYFLTECSLCKDNGLFSVVYIFKQVLSVVFMIIPIILIVLVLIDLAKNVIANKDDDMTKNRNIAIKRIIYAIAIFLVPFMVNVVMHVLYDLIDNGSNKSFLTCWENATLSNVRACNDEATSNENARDEEKKADSDSKMSDYKNKSQEQANSREKALGKKTEDNNSDNNNNNSNNDNSSAVNDGGGNTSDRYIIFVGDSRMEGVKAYVNANSNEIFIAKQSMGVIWLNGVARSSVIEELKKHNDANIIVNIGINDITGINEARRKQIADMYMNFCKKILTDYPNSRVIVTNVGPVDESVGKYSVKNKDILAFNSVLSSAVSNLDVNGKKAKYCSFSYDGFETVDGLHYMPSTYRNIVYTGFKNCLNG